jgi:hypothetical protein
MQAGEKITASSISVSVLTHGIESRKEFFAKTNVKETILLRHGPHLFDDGIFG